MLAFWDSFGEIFGMPIRVGETTSRDPKKIAKIEKMLDEMGVMPWGLFSEGTTIKLIETSRGDAFNVYDKRIDRANSEISKGILNQIMTIDSGSSYSQSEVHLQIFDNVVEVDADFVRDVINNKLLPFMAMYGFPVDNYRFDWDDTVEYTPEQMRTIEQMLLSSGYEIEPEYFVEKYNISITGKKEATFFFD
jgi:phage gp29-like protein